MRRPQRQGTPRGKVGGVRGAIPDLAIRTTCLVGFPGETDDDFRELLAFLEEAQFDRLGAFSYSPQEGTRATQYPDDVPDAVKRERLEELLEVQRAISAERLARFVGREVRVLVDRVADPDEARATRGGRVAWQADDVDGVTYVERGHIRGAGRLGRIRVLPACPAHGQRRLRLPGGRPDVSRSEELFERAKAVLPGGVNSPARAFRAVGGTPFFVARAEGSRLTDVDGRTSLDYVCSWGPLILGHAHPAVLQAIRAAAERGWTYGASCEAEVDLAEAVRQRMPAVEMVRFVNSGTEATMAALRLARAATRREVVLKFEGCYHGHADSFLVKAGSGEIGRASCRERV